MEKLFERLNLYDILAMICPGSIVLMGLGMFDKICDNVQDLYFVQYYGAEGHAFWTFTGTIFFLVLAYMIGIIIQQLNVWFWCRAKYLNERYIRHYAENKIDDKRSDLYQLFYQNKQIVENVRNPYYEAYNYAIVYNPQSVVLTLEKQIALLRNMMLAIIPLCIAVFTLKWYWILLIIVGIEAVLFGIICARMYKAVVLVCEEYETVKQLGLDKKENN